MCQKIEENLTSSYHSEISTDFSLFKMFYQLTLSKQSISVGNSPQYTKNLMPIKFITVLFVLQIVGNSRKTGSNTVDITIHTLVYSKGAWQNISVYNDVQDN